MLKRIKVYIIAVIAIFTLLALLYLVYMAEELDEYTISSNDGRKCFVLYSSSGGNFEGGGSTKDILKFCSETLKSAGYNSVIIEDTYEKGSGLLRENIIKKLSKSKKYVLLDINSGLLVVSRNTALIRLGNRNNVKFRDNLELAGSIKGQADEKRVKVRIYTDTKDNYNQDLGYRAIGIELSNKATLTEARNVLSEILKGVIK